MNRNLAPFLVEEWMNQHEERVQINLGETCVDSLTLEELLRMDDPDLTNLSDLGAIRLSYLPILGSETLREAIASLYHEISPTQVIPSHGAIGANHQVIMTLLSRGDEAVIVMPTYQQHLSLPQSLGVITHEFWLEEGRGYRPDLDRLAELITSDTKLISIVNPNNPTGARLSRDEMERVVSLAKSVGAYILADEVYRGLEEDDEPSFVDLYDKAVSTGSMSKVFSLAGLRLGWIASQDEELLAAIRSRRDYDVISIGVLDDYLAGIALKHRQELMARNRPIVARNRKVLLDWAERTPRVRLVTPVAGTTALVHYDAPLDSYNFCLRLIEDKSVLVTPGDAFGVAKSFRVGYAYDADQLTMGLEKIAELFLEMA